MVLTFAKHNLLYFCLEKIKPPPPLPKPKLFLSNSNDCNCDEPQKYAFNKLLTD